MNINSLIERLHNYDRDGPNPPIIDEAADTLEALNKVYEAAKVVKRVGYYAQEHETGRFSGDILLAAIEELEGKG